MAKQSNTDEENKKLKEQIELLRKRLELQQDSFDLSSSIVDSLRESLGIEIRRSTMEKSTLKTNQDINSSILNQKTGLSDINTIQKQIVKNEDLIKKGKLIENSLLSSIGNKLSKNGNIVESRIKKQAQQNKQLAEYNKRIEEGLSIDIKSYEALKQKTSLNEEILAQEFGKLSSLEQQYILTKQNTKALEDQQKVREAEKGIQDQLETQLGLSGKLAKVLGTIPGAGDASKKALEEVTKEIQAQVEASGELPSRWKTFGMLVGKTFKGLGKSLTDPLVTIEGIKNLFTTIDDRAGEMAKSMNMTYSEALSTGRELSSMAISSGDIALNGKNLSETLMFVGKQLGSNAKLNEADLKTYTKLREQAGYTNEELYGIQQLSLVNGKSLENNTEEILGGAKAYASRNKLVVNEKDILREVSKASATIKLSLGGSAEAVAEAAVQAKQFGLNLEQADQIAQSLLQFESSIENELSAELLLGKDLNFEKARQLSLNNDIAGAAEEIAKQVGTSADFAKMNAIQQEAIAKAAGLTKESLAQSLMDKEALANLSAKEGESAQEAFNRLVDEVGMEEAKKQLGNEELARQYEQQSVQEKFTNAVEHLKELLISIVDGPFGMILNILSESMWLITSIGVGLATWYTTSKLIAGVQKSIAFFKGLSLAADKNNVSIGKQMISQLGVMVGLSSAKAAADSTASVASSFGLMLPVLLGAGAAIWGMISSFKANDMMSPGGSGGGYGKRTLFGPEGAIQLNDKDTVIAGTNLFDKGNDMYSGPQGAISVSNSTAPRRESTVDPNVGMNARLDKLISVTERVNTISTLRVQ
jgi:hypothetical protein